MPAELVLGPVVRDPGDPPGAAAAGVELAESPTATPVSARSAGPGTPPGGRRPVAVVRGCNRSAAPSHAGAGSAASSRRHPVPVVAGHCPHLAVPPRRVRLGVLDHDRLDPLGHRRRPRPLRWVAGMGPGLPTPPGPLGHVDELAEPRGRHARLDADHLEVAEGPSRYSATVFFDTRQPSSRRSAVIRGDP
jgi:hypothetical protein